jgi:hypothetical protein
VPERTFTVAADYTRDLDWLGGATGNLYVGYSYRDETSDATTKGLSSGELNDLTIRASVKKDGWSLEAFATNALDDDDAAVESSTALQILYPRRIGVRLGIDF